MLNSDYTRQRIINAAYDLFGRIGYTATTVRMIADKADVSLSAIPYYFESKENLFRFIADLSISEFGAYFSEVNQQIEKYLKSDSQDSEMAAKLLEKFIRKHLDYVFDPENSIQLKFLFQLRSSQDHPDCSNDGFYNITIHPLCCLIRILRPDIKKMDEAVVLAYSIIGEHLVFCYHKPSILKQLRIGDYGDYSEIAKSILVDRDMKSFICCE